jgi:hypothetical protein
VLILLLTTALGFFAQTGLPTVASAQVGKITGSVIEARTGAPLPAVLVKVQSTGQQAFSGADGKFEINDVPVGSQTLLVSVVGYGLVRRDVTVSGTDAVDVTIPVNEGASTYVEEVSVGRQSLPAKPSLVWPRSRSWAQRELMALRGLIADDPFRAVQMLPGVSTGDDFRAEFALRGLGPGHIGLSVDGIDSPLLYHTVRGVQDTGSLALVNTDILESASLLAGPHPQRLNSHLGSRVDFATPRRLARAAHGRAMVSARRPAPSGKGRLARARRAAGCLPRARATSIGCLQMIDTTTAPRSAFTDAQAKFTFDLTPETIAARVDDRGPLDLREQMTVLIRTRSITRPMRPVIGNVQWRFTPSRHSRRHSRSTS